MIQKGTMYNLVHYLLALHQLRPPKVLKVLEVNWCLHCAGYIKMNTDGATNDSLGSNGCGGVFGTSRDFVKCCFAVNLDGVFAFRICQEIYVEEWCSMGSFPTWRYGVIVPRFAPKIMLPMNAT